MFNKFYGDPSTYKKVLFNSNNIEFGVSQFLGLSFLLTATLKKEFFGELDSRFTDGTVLGNDRCQLSNSIEKGEMRISIILANKNELLTTVL